MSICCKFLEKRSIAYVVLSLLALLCLTRSAEAADPAWAPNTYYAAGAKVTFSGISFRCRQAHTSATGWEPPNVHALWERPTPSGIQPWAVQTAYLVGTEVLFGGIPYKCLQANNSEVNWDPISAPALWTRICTSDPDGTCTANKVMSTYSNLPSTTTFSRVANSDLTYLVTRITMWVPALGSGSADQWGLRDKIEVVMTERTTEDNRIFQWFRNGTLLVGGRRY